ncbi:MAG: glycosyltransferase [Tildeniella nuda ZEHNDER 1965/U140]|jgi:GT2 family glycosyltransferase|nr:glycosyltransferase [Tildeniella nuda ZEHNDER 1965/U140]
MKAFPTHRPGYNHWTVSTEIYQPNPIADDLTVSVIVPVYNGGENFRQCLQSLSLVAPNVLEIIVVDDGSTDDSKQLAEQAGFTVLQFPTAGGPARARNRGAQVANGTLLFFMDADTTLTVCTIEQMVQAFRDRPDLAALVGSYDDAPGAPNFLSQYKNLLHHYTHQTACEDASTFWGACGAIRRDIFWKVRGFDERYRYPSIEDIELGYRLKRAGYLIQLNKTVQVKHLKHWQVGSLLRAEVFYRAIPWTELLWRDRQLNNDLNLKNATRFSILLTYALLACLVAGWWSASWTLGLGLALLLLIVNRDIYQFFYQKRGLWFTLRVIPWHWLYFFYCGLALIVGTLRYHLRRLPKMRSKALS